MNVVMTGAGRFIEVQGTAEGNAVLTRRSSTSCSTWRRRGSPRSSSSSEQRWPSRRRRARRDGRFVLATANPDKAREIVAPARRGRRRRLELVARPPEVPDVDEVGDDARGQRPHQGGRALRRHLPPGIADDTGLHVDALGGAPGVHTARYAGEDATYADNVREAARASSTRCRSSNARRASPRWPSPAGRTGSRWPRWARSRASSRVRHAVTVGSGTTRCSCRSRATAARSRR